MKKFELIFSRRLMRSIETRWYRSRCLRTGQ